MKLIHPVSGELKKLSIGDFLDLFDESVRSAIIASKGRYPKAEAIVCFENLQLDSSQCGKRSALVVGPENSYTLAAIMRNGRLGDVPSRFQYPVAFVDYREGDCVVCDNCQGRGEFPDHCRCVRCGGLGYEVKLGGGGAVSWEKEKAETKKDQSNE